MVRVVKVVHVARGPGCPSGPCGLGCQCGPCGQGCPGGQGGPGGQACPGVRVVLVIKFVNEYGLHGLNNQIIEKNLRCHACDTVDTLTI